VEETIRIMNRVSETKVFIERRKINTEMHEAMIAEGYIQLPEETIDEL